MRPFLTVFVPAYNEQASLQNSVEAVLRELDKLNVPAEILIVDDGSRDQTGKMADELLSRYPCVRAAHHPANRGIGGLFLTAVGLAQGEWMILIPADLAMDPRDLGAYLEAAPGSDVVVGLRSNRCDYTLLRRIISWTNIRLIQILFGMNERQFQYISMYRTDVLRGMEIECWRSAFFLPEILIKAKTGGKKLSEVEICYAPRVSGKATGAKLKLVILTVVDMFRFWVKWGLLGGGRRFQIR